MEPTVDVIITVMLIMTVIIDCDDCDVDNYFFTSSKFCIMFCIILYYIDENKGKINKLETWSNKIGSPNERRVNVVLEHKKMFYNNFKINFDTK